MPAPQLVNSTARLLRFNNLNYRALVDFASTLIGVQLFPVVCRYAWPHELDLMARIAGLRLKEPWIVPIPGTTKLDRLEENIGAVAIELTPDDLREIGLAAAEIRVHGARYSEEQERRTGR